MGRWSRLVAVRFLDWLGAPAEAAWLDLGCGTGALTQTILARCEPRSIVAVDPSADFVAHARAATSDARQLSATWSAFFPPGIAQLTASNIKREALRLTGSEIARMFYPWKPDTMSEENRDMHLR